MKSPKEQYPIEPWMRTFFPLFANTGGNEVEDLLHDDETTPFNNEIRYLLITAARSQYALLVKARNEGLLVI